MTLIITLVNKDRIVQVSDRRLTTLTGDIYDDGSNKAVAVGMSYVHFTACYTGLAFIGRERKENRTDYWLQEHLGSITRDGEPSLEAICESLSQRATDAVSRLRGEKRNKGLKVILAGFDRANRPFRATVSNIRFSSHDTFDVRDRFVWNLRRYQPWDPMPDMDMAGAVGAFYAKDGYAKRLKKIRDTVARQFRKHDKRLNDEQAARRLVTLVRAASTHPVYGYLIGRDCLSVVAVPKTPSMDMLYSMSVAPAEESSRSTPFVGFYHPMAATTVLYGPLLVDPYMDTLSFEVDLDPHVPATHEEAEMEAQRRQQNIAAYYTAFYDEVRGQLAGSGVEVKDTPHFLRDHMRRIHVAECRDGYLVLHYADHENVHGTDTPETFELETNFRDKTVSELTELRYQPGAAFYHVFAPTVRNETEGEYVEPEGWERRDAISNIKAAQLTQEEARQEAREAVRPLLR